MIDQRCRVHFAPGNLDRTAINTVYSHVLNPMVASRSYMCIEPIELHLDVNALRRGLIMPVDPDIESNALQVQDSGMVPVSTQISIVNPETNQLCLVGEYGEIWVQSEANAHSFYGSKERLDAERFNGRTLDGDPNVRYVRTGDLGFLHNVTRPIGPGGAPVDMQVLFVLGSIGDTFDVNGLNHFSMDIESSVERCHRNIIPQGCAVFQAGGLVVVVVEIFRRNFLASMVPVIVNAILNEHQLVIDIVAFVQKGDFHRSRLGEKQRGKILAGWVTRKMRTIAQYSIRDPNGSDAQMISEEPVGRASTSTFMRGPASTKGSLRASSTLGLTAQAQLNSMHLSHRASMQDLSAQQQQQYAPGQLPPNQDAYAPQQSLAELENRTQSLSLDPNHPGLGSLADANERTPTDARRDFLPTPTQHNSMMDYSPVDPTRAGVFDSPVDGPGQMQGQNQYPPQHQQTHQPEAYQHDAYQREAYQPGAYQPETYHPEAYEPQEPPPIPSILRVGSAKPDEPAPFQYAPTQFQQYQPLSEQHENQPQQWGLQDSNPALGLTRTYSSEDEAPRGGLRVANRDSMASNDSWTRDALAQMNYAGAGSPGRAK